MSCGATSIRIEPMDVSWQIEEQTDIMCVADVSSSLNSKYFLINTALNATKYYVWFDVANTGVDPAVAGRTGVEVNISANASAAAVATALQTALDALAGFEATVDGSEVVVTNVAVGETDATEDGAAATGFTFTRCQVGVDLDLGELDGDIELSFELSTLEVTSHQSGSQLITELRQGQNVEVSLTMQETDIPKLKALMTAVNGGTDTPLSGTEVFGWGDSKLGKSTLPDSARLVLHPVNLDTTDKSRDWCIWKAFPLPESITFSGTEKEVVSMTFKAYKDDSKPSAIRVFAVGDWSQYLPT